MRGPVISLFDVEQAVEQKRSTEGTGVGEVGRGEKRHEVPAGVDCARTRSVVYAAPRDQTGDKITPCAFCTGAPPLPALRIRAREHFRRA